MSLLFIKTLYRCGIIDQGNNNLAVLGRAARIDEDVIPVQDTGIDHGGSVNLQDIRLSGRNILGRNREIALDVLLREDRLPGGNAAHYRKRGCLRAEHLEIVITDLNGTRLRRIPLNISVLLERLQMRMNGRGRLQINRPADLADRRRITPVKDFLLDVIQDFLLFLGNTSLRHVCPSAFIPI